MSNRSVIPTFGQQPQSKQKSHQQQQVLVQGSPYGLLQSARRRLQCSQLPVRSGAFQKQQDCRLANSLRKFPVLGTPKHQISRGARKSLSMVDLSPANDYDKPEASPKSCKTMAPLDDGDQLCSEEILAVRINESPRMNWSRESRAASLISRALAINCWRRRREEIVQLRNSITILYQNLEHVKIQIVVLRRLLDNENVRVANLAGELHRARAHTEEISKERDNLKMEKNTAEGEVQKQRELAEDRLVTVENLRNEMRSLQDQVNLLDKQIEKDRDKLLKLTEDKKVLFEKVSTTEAVAATKAERVHKAELLLEETQMQLTSQIALSNSLQEELLQCLNNLKEKVDQNSELEKMLEIFKKDNEAVKERLISSEKMYTRVADLESQLLEEQLKISQFETMYNAQTSELNELREKLLKQSEESGWSYKVLKIAGSVIRVPCVILRTLSFLTTGMSVIL